MGLKEAIEALTELDGVFKSMRASNVQQVDAGPIIIKMFSHDTYRIFRRDDPLVDKLFTGDDQPAPAHVKADEEKHYSNDEILLDPYVGLDNG